MPTSASSADSFFPSSIHISPCPTELSRTFPSSTTQLITQTRTFTFTFPAAMAAPRARLTQYAAVQPGAIRGPHSAEHIRRRWRWWTDLRRIQPEHHHGPTVSDQPHGTEKDCFLCGAVRGSNAVPSNSCSGNSNGQHGNSVINAGEGNVHTAVSNAILVGFAERFWL